MQRRPEFCRMGRSLECVSTVGTHWSSLRFLRCLDNFRSTARLTASCGTSVHYASSSQFFAEPWGAPASSGAEAAAPAAAALPQAAGCSDEAVRNGASPVQPS